MGERFGSLQQPYSFFTCSKYTRDVFKAYPMVSLELLLWKTRLSRLNLPYLRELAVGLTRRSAARIKADTFME